MSSVVNRRRVRAAIVSAAALLASGIGALVAPAPMPASAFSTQSPAFSGIGCNANNDTSTWGSVTVPANAVTATFTIVGGGGGGGDNGGSGEDGGVGGGGGSVTGTFNVTPGQVVWAKVGCGSPDAAATADGYTRGGNLDNRGGGGGGSTAICVGSGTASCGGGTVHGIAGGGGGGGKAFNGCGADDGGGGGTANVGSDGSGFGGISRGSGRGGNGEGGTSGGGGGGGIGQGPGQNTGANTPNNTGGTGGTGDGGRNAQNGGNATSVSPSGSGGNGSAGLGDDGFISGGGGGGFTGGGAGGGGDDGTACDNESGAGGGAGSSWVSGSVTGIAFGWAGNNVGCGGDNVDGVNAGVGGSAQGQGCDGNATISFRIQAPPTGANQTTATATKGVALTGINLANGDTDGDSRTCEQVGSATKGSATVNSNCTASYTASANTDGNGTFTYRVRDSDNMISPTYTVTVPIGNRVPVSGAQSVNVTKGTAATINLASSDPDGDSPLTCEVTSGPSKGSVSTGTSCSRTYTGAANGYGTDSFTYVVKDAYSGTSTASTITLNIQNRAPSATAQTVSAAAGGATAITLAGTDLDSDSPLTCATTTSPGKGGLTGSGCSRTYTSNAGTANAGIGGSDSFGFTVADGAPATSSAATVTINIANPNLSLTKSHTGRFNEGVGTGTYTLTVANSATAAANGTTTLTDTLPAGMVYRSSNAGSSGFTCSGTPGVSTTVTCTRSTAIPTSTSVSFTITVDVAAGASSPVSNQAVVSSLYELASTAADNTATDATDINHRPSAADQTVVTGVDSAVLVTLTGTDPDGDSLTFTIGTGPGQGSLSGSGATRQYVPNTGFRGVDTFTYTVTDTGTPGLVSTTRTVTIQVGVTRLGGVVTDEVSGAPIAGVEARLVDMADPQAGVLVATVTTNGSGVYDFGTVAFGTYGVRFVDPSNDHISEWFDDAPTSATANLFALDDTAISVTRSVELRPGGRITGTVRSTSVPNPVIEGLQVRLVKIGSPGSQAKTTSVSGGYAFELLQPGSYQLWFRDLASGQWVSEWYGDVATQAESTTIEVSVGQQVTIDEQISPVAPPPAPDSGSVAGTVTDSVTGDPLPGVQVRLYKDPYTGSSSTTTDANGQYSFTRLAPASYRLWFRDMTGTRISEYGGDASTLAEADTLTLANDGEIVNATLAPKAPAPPANSGVISGTVLEVDGFTPIVGLQVRLYPVNGSGSRATTTDANGGYAFTGLVPGQYQVFFRDLGKTWFSEWHLDAATQAASTPVAAVNGQTTDIDATLGRK